MTINKLEKVEKLVLTEENFPVFYAKKINEVEQKSLKCEMPVKRSIEVNLQKLEQELTSEELAEKVGKQLFNIMDEVRRNQNMLDLYETGKLENRPRIEETIIQILPLENLYHYIGAEGVNQFLELMLTVGTKCGYYLMAINNGKNESIPVELYGRFKTVVAKSGLEEANYLTYLGNTEEVKSFATELNKEGSKENFVVKNQ
jgi:hypothetical protein